MWDCRLEYGKGYQRLSDKQKGMGFLPISFTMICCLGVGSQAKRGKCYLLNWKLNAIAFLLFAVFPLLQRGVASGIV
jgi:hypothetical protein